MVEKRILRRHFFRILDVSIFIKPSGSSNQIFFRSLSTISIIFIKNTAVKYISLIKSNKSIKSHKWPGNVRGFINTIERFFVLCNKDKIFLSDILYYGQKTESKTPVSNSQSGNMTLVEIEKENIEKSFKDFSHLISITAGFLGMVWKTFRLTIINYGIKPKD
jgi:DNA-binding NtrC family response regulator